MGFLKLTMRAGGGIRINFALVADYVRDTDSSGTKLWIIGDDDTRVVRETVEQIDELLTKRGWL